MLHSFVYVSVNDMGASVAQWMDSACGSWSMDPVRVIDGARKGIQPQ